MPYINKYERSRIELGYKTPQDAGELNFVLTSVLLEYVEQFGLNYKAVNDCVGAVECAKLELYRRTAAPYEDRKIEDNGDVYPAHLLNGGKNV